MSKELKEYLLDKGVATSRTTPYHPTGNGQAERYVGVIWKAIRLALKSVNQDERNWESVLQAVLHSQRSLLCTSTNCTPHERFFSFQRRNTNGDSLPSWLMKPGPVLLRRFVRSHKNEPLVDQVQLLESNPTSASIKYPDGRESTVSVKDLAPCPESEEIPDPDNATNENTAEVPIPDSEPAQEVNEPKDGENFLSFRRSARTIKAPQRYGWDE